MVVEYRNEMLRLLLTILTTTACLSLHVYGQDNSPVLRTDAKYFRQIEKKVETYNSRLTAKTEKTLVRLSRWEARIQKALQKASPETGQRLFGRGQLTFGRLLQQFREGEIRVKNYQNSYDGYLDSLATTTKFLREGKEKLSEEITLSSKGVQQGMDSLDKNLAQTGYIKSFIRERKRLLVAETLKYAGHSRALKKMDRESYYYVETLRNYKELFSNESRREELVKKTLNRIPAFQKFMRENSVLSSLFAVPGNGATNNSMATLAGLQTRASVQNIIQNRMAAGGLNAAAQLQQNLAEAQSKLTEIKDKLLKGGHIGADGDVEMPDPMAIGFKPNSQRSKTLWQRLEYRFDVQFSKSSSYLPSTTDIGAGVGYRLNDRSVAGMGISYKLGMGSIEHIRLSSEGVGFRSFIDWRVKGRWYASGGYELNYMSAFKSIADLKDAAWQRSGLIGISRQYSAGRKMKGEVKVLWDFLYRQHVPQSAPVVFRVGYKL